MRTEIKMYRRNFNWTTYNSRAYACKEGVRRYFDIPENINQVYLVLTDETDEESLAMRVIEKEVEGYFWGSQKRCFIQFRNKNNSWRREGVLSSGIEELLRFKIINHFGLNKTVYVSVEYNI